MATQPDGSRTAQLVALQQAVAANAAGRNALTDNLVAQVRAMLAAFTGWYDEVAVKRLSKDIAGLVSPTQRVMASQEDAYLSQAATALTTKPFRPVGPVAVTDLRAGVAPEDVYQRLAVQYRYERSVDTPEPDALTHVLTRADVMNQTDVALAARSQDQHFFETHKITGYRRVIHPELAKGGTCGLCIAASDRIYRSNRLMPIHARCITGDTSVSAVGVQAVTRRLYAGQFVVLSTASGNQLTVTPNHPVLTDQGWVPAGLVNVGDDVVGGGRGQWAVGGGPHEQHGPASVEQVWRALTVDHGLRPRSVPLAAEDFHGDGTDGEVDVVLVDRALSDVGAVTFAQPASHQRLVWRWLGGSCLASDRSLPELVGVGGHSSHRDVGIARDGLALLPGRSYVAERSGGRHAAATRASLSQDSSDYRPVHREGRGQVKLGLSALVAQAHLLGGDVLAPERVRRFDPAGFEFAEQGRRAYADLGRDLRERLAGDVQSDRLVDKRWVEGSRHVYNLHTSEGWYSANDYIVSNCHCGVMPVIGGYDAGSALNDLDLSDLYTAAGANTAAALKRTRYSVLENGELGPTLAVHGATRPGYVAA